MHSIFMQFSIPVMSIRQRFALHVSIVSTNVLDAWWRLIPISIALFAIQLTWGTFKFFMEIQIESHAESNSSS